MKTKPFGRSSLTALTSLVAGFAWALSAGAAEPAVTAVSALCADCHEEVVAAFPTSPHGRSYAHSKAYGKASCESCHAGAAAHAESGEPEDLASPAHLSGLAGSASCIDCHRNQKHVIFWQGSAHETAGLACLDCHSVHAPSVVKGGVALQRSQLCVSCHVSSRLSLNQRSHHPIKEGKVNCLSCHDPHGTKGEKLVKGDSVNDLCYTCHQQMRGPFLWEHSPVREDCLTCHTPHGSNQDKLLVTRTVQLCQSCHLQGRHQTVAGSDRALWNSNRSCLNCHSQIHGSNHPSGPLFQR